jgi:hypothetical protein
MKAAKRTVKAAERTIATADELLLAATHATDNMPAVDEKRQQRAALAEEVLGIIEREIGVDEFFKSAQLTHGIVAAVRLAAELESAGGRSDGSWGALETLLAFAEEKAGQLYGVTSQIEEAVRNA